MQEIIWGSAPKQRNAEPGQRHHRSWDPQTGTVRPSHRRCCISSSARRAACRQCLRIPRRGVYGV